MQNIRQNENVAKNIYSSGDEKLVSSWEAVSEQTIVNCFRKAGITPKAQNAAIADTVDPFSDLKESLQQLHDIDPDMVPEGVTLKSH